MSAAKTPRPEAEPPKSLTDELQTQRRTVDFDTYDIHVLQLLSSIGKGQIFMLPAFQRKFRWTAVRSSQLVESLLLGIPVPNLFMATNPDGTWEVVDGIQRLSAIAWFAGDDAIRAKLNLGDRLTLQGLQKLGQFNGLTFDRLPGNIQTHFETRPVKVVTLNDKSNDVVRYDLFERLNNGGVVLSDQEIRDCVYRGAFADKLETWTKEPNFQKVVVLTAAQKKDGTAEECVLRFFAFRDDYLKFDHSVKDFLNSYMAKAQKNFDADEGDAAFKRAFAQLAQIFPDGLRRPGKVRSGNTSLILYEAVAVGAALALQHTKRLSTKSVKTWLASEALKRFTTGSTNDRSAVRGRFEFCRDRFLGKPYVPSNKT